MEGTFRTLDPAVCDETKEKLRRLARGLSEASDVAQDISFDIDEKALGVGMRVMARAVILAARPDEGK